MTHEATRLAQKAKWLAYLIPDYADHKAMLGYIDALAALAQPAPTAEVALPAVSEEVKSVGRACAMPWTTGFTMACFKDDDVPVGAELYARAQSAAKGDAP